MSLPHPVLLPSRRTSFDVPAGVGGRASFRRGDGGRGDGRLRPGCRQSPHDAASIRARPRFSRSPTRGVLAGRLPRGDCPFATGRLNLSLCEFDSAASSSAPSLPALDELVHFQRPPQARRGPRFAPGGRVVRFRTRAATCSASSTATRAALVPARGPGRRSGAETACDRFALRNSAPPDGGGCDGRVGNPRMQPLLDWSRSPPSLYNSSASCLRQPDCRIARHVRHWRSVKPEPPANVLGWRAARSASTE